jgi:hypothetical protein
MAYRFPGMNPYLEQPALWPEVHKRLIVALADELNPLLNPTYRVAIEERVYEGDEDALFVGIPDNLVVRSEFKRETQPTTLDPFTTATLTVPKVVQLPQIVPVKQWYLEVRRVTTREVVTIVEILSPKNKRAGEGRQDYLQKRQRILNSKTHLIEIDLLRRNQPMPLAESTPQTPGTYHILISRSDDRPQALLYEFGIRQPIPTFVMPLADTNTPEPLVAIQQLIEGLYDRAGFDMDIDYSQQPTPSLGDEDWQWSQQLTSPTVL